MASILPTHSGAFLFGLAWPGMSMLVVSHICRWSAEAQDPLSCCADGQATRVRACFLHLSRLWFGDS